MKRLLAGCVVFLSATVFGQQTKSPVSDVAREMLPGREKNTVAAFEQMPTDKFVYKPTPDQMTFGHLAAHIASGNYFFCSNAGDVPRPKRKNSKEPKIRLNWSPVSRLPLNSVAPRWPKPTTQN